MPQWHMAVRLEAGGCLCTSAGAITLGQAGWAYFSQSNDHYLEITKQSPEVYLRAFVHGANRVVLGLTQGMAADPYAFQVEQDGLDLNDPIPEYIAMP